MELIAALEQLSLRVKTSQHLGRSDVASGNNEAQQLQEAISDLEMAPNFANQTANRQYSSHHTMMMDDLRQRQLGELDNSIETLCMQISDLDFPDNSVIINPSVSGHRQSVNPQLRRSNFCQNGRLMRNLYSGTSTETSQEEDSDNSSQQSGYTTGDRHTHTDPFIRDLLRRDLGAITDTVRKIGRILAIGSEIVTIYKNLISQSQFMNQNSIEKRSQPQVVCGQGLGQDNLDVAYSRSLCDTFTSLCSSEPYISDLPTIIRYNNYCQQLLSQLNKLKTSSSTANNQFSNNGDALASHELNSDDMLMSDDDNDDDNVCIENDIGDTLECALFECDQRRMDNWTENKLYKNYQSSFSNESNTNY